MQRVKRLLALSGLTGLALASAGVGTAGAAGIKSVCITQGSVKTNPPVPLVGGAKGTYAFATQLFLCVGIEKLSLPPVGAIYTGSSTGIYKNIVCGTGKAASLSVSVSGQTPLGSLTLPKTSAPLVASQMQYVLEFVGFQGLLYFNNASVHKAAIPKVLEDLPLGNPKGSDNDEGLAGFVEVIPDPTKAIAFCSKGFQVVAVVVIDTENINLF